MLIFILFYLSLLKKSLLFSLMKEKSYYRIAEMFTGSVSGFDYGRVPELGYPGGIVYLYKCLSLLPEGFRFVVPWMVFFYFLFLVAYLMRRCRIPALFMAFFVFPVGALLQGQALRCVLPEILGLTGLLQTLVALLSGRRGLAMISLTVGLLFDVVAVGPLLPALLLGLMRMSGARWSMIWLVAVLAGFTFLSGPFLVANASAYWRQSLRLDNIATWNPLVWLLHRIKVGFLSRSVLEGASRSATWSFLVHAAAQGGLINFRWLFVDGGVLGLVKKFHNSSRGYGIRPNPWTPRQMLTVVFEAMLVTRLLSFPSLIDSSDFGILSVLLGSFFCIALADPIPLPAIFGLLAAITFPLTFLYRKFELEVSDYSGQHFHFHPQIHATLHFLPMLVLPAAQLAVLLFLKRRDVPLFTVQKKLKPQSPTFPDSSHNSSPLTAATTALSNHHRRSNSLSRRKNE